MQLKTLLRGCLLALACVVGLQLSAQSSSCISYRTSDVRVTSSPMVTPTMSSTVMAIHHAPQQAEKATSVVVPTVSLTPRVHVYKPFSNTLPSSYSPVLRRANTYNIDDDDNFLSGGATDGNAGDVGNQSQESPVGSPIILALFALAYGVIVYRKKQPLNLIKQRTK